MGNEEQFQCTEKGIYSVLFKNKQRKHIKNVL
jgi:hypothetical protein